MESNGMSWRNEYLELKAGLSEQQIKLLTEGPKKLTDAWALQAMLYDYKETFKRYQK